VAHDIVIRGGQIVDGTGSEPVHGDLAIDDGVLTAVGQVEGEGRQEIDAGGHLVTPGFVDIHTHLDAQIGWDPTLVNGQLRVWEGEHTGARSETVLRHDSRE